MTQDEIIRSPIGREKLVALAREACAPNQTFNSDEEWVKRFAALVAAHEREACAKVCDDLIGTRAYAVQCAAAIRARSTSRGKK